MCKMSAALKLRSMTLLFNFSNSMCFPQRSIGLHFTRLNGTKRSGTGGKRKTKQKKQKIYNRHPVMEHILMLQNEAKHVQKDKGILIKENENILHSIETNRSQVLGFNVDEFRKRIYLFRAIDVCITDAITLSLSIPSSLHINDSNFKKILKILRSHGLSVETIIYKHPYIGAIDHRQIQRNINLLEELQLQKCILCELFVSNPLLLAYPLNKISIETLKKTSFGLDKASTIFQNLTISLETPGVENENIKKFIETSEDFDPSVNMEGIEFLSSYDVDYQKVYLECPELLVASRDVIELCTDNIVSAPFYFGLEDIEKLLRTYPGVFLSFSQEDVMTMVKYLQTVSLSQNHLYRILSQYPEIFQDPEKFFQRVELFKSVGFTDKHIGLLLSQKSATNCFIECEDFNDNVILDLLGFYLKDGDLDIQQIIFSAPISLSSKFKDMIKTRIWYLRHTDNIKDLSKRRKKHKSHVTLQTVVKSNLKKFVEEICKQTLEHYEENLQVYQNSNKN